MFLTRLVVLCACVTIGGGLPNFDICNFLTVSEYECNSYAEVEINFGNNGQNGQIAAHDGINYGTNETESSISVTDAGGNYSSFGYGKIFNDSFDSSIGNGNTETAYTISSFSLYSAMMNVTGTCFGQGKASGEHSLSALTPWVNGISQEGKTRWLMQIIYMDVQMSGPLQGNYAYASTICHNAYIVGSIDFLNLGANTNLEYN